MNTDNKDHRLTQIKNPCESVSKIRVNPCIKFGTDGWRGIIAKDFTFKNVGIAAQAIADYIKSEIKGMEIRKLGKVKNLISQSPNLSIPAVIIGYDNRFLSDKFALHTAKVFSANGISAVVSSVAATSPSVSLYCKKNNCLGIMITASHNPPVWNGLKIKLQYGGSVSEKIIDTISGFLYKNEVKITDDEIKTADIINDYKKYLKSLVRLNLPRPCSQERGSVSKLKITIDSMYGSGVGIFEQMFKNGKNIIAIHNNRDPLFSGINPEPIEKNLMELKKAVLKNRSAVGFAFDGDADRLGVIDDKGRYLSPHIVFPLILLYLLEGRKMKGKVVQAVSLGYLSERIAKKFNTPFEEVSVGFKYICEKMLNEDVLLGGEESGGYGWSGGIPERDGILNALLITEMLSGTKKKLSMLVDDLQKIFGKSYYKRIDIKLKQPVDKDDFTNYVKKIISKKKGIREVRTYDGIKIIFENDNWLLLRPSGTEPVLRTYSETDSIAKTDKLLDFAGKICFNLL
ncbi:MAG: phosphoglucomutase/phosphomannomutase family protein [Elusimicrobia bacterium]|nr:phosphoglucomutase/phosphomannomutase family protein [Elusimicrobiota bacterium]